MIRGRHVSLPVGSLSRTVLPSRLIMRALHRLAQILTVHCTISRQGPSSVLSVSHNRRGWPLGHRRRATPYAIHRNQPPAAVACSCLDPNTGAVTSLTVCSSANFDTCASGSGVIVITATMAFTSVDPVFAAAIPQLSATYVTRFQ